MNDIQDNNGSRDGESAPMRGRLPLAIGLAVALIVSLSSWALILRGFSSK